MRKDANLFAFDINKKYKKFNILKLDLDKIEELSENCESDKYFEKEKESNICNEEVSQIIRKNLQFY